MWGRLFVCAVLWSVWAKLKEDGHVRSPPDLRNSRSKTVRTMGGSGRHAREGTDAAPPDEAGRRRAAGWERSALPPRAVSLLPPPGLLLSSPAALSLCLPGVVSFLSLFSSPVPSRIGAQKLQHGAEKSG